MAVQTKLQVRRDTAANWTSTNPTLASGEIGFETDTLKFKVGNGSTAWTSLKYSQDASLLNGTASITALSTTGDINTAGKLNVTASAGDEGGEIFLAKSVTNTSINTGVTIDVYQNRLRFFEQGGSARGYYIDITAGGAGVSTALTGGGGSGTVTSITAGTNGLTGGTITTSGTIDIDTTKVPLLANNITTFAATTGATTFVVKQGATQSTTNLIEIQNTTGSVLAVATSGGSILTTGNLGAGTTTALSTARFSVSAAASSIGIIVRGNATTPGNLQEWQNSTPTTLASISNTGAFTATTITSTQATGTAPFTVTSTTRVANLNVATSGTTSNVLGGATGGVIYQSAANTTAFLTAPATNNSVLTYNTATGAPEWDSPATAMATIMGYTSTATAAGFTSLTNASSYYQQFTGTTTQTVVLPNTATLITGWTFHIVNNSTANVTANTFANAATLMVIPANTTAMVTCVDITSNTATGWEIGLTDFGTYTGTGSVVMGTLPTITPANAVAATSASTAGYIGLPQISVSANTAILATHAGKHIYTTTTALTHTIPANTNVAFEIGTTLTFITAPSVSLSIAITTDTMYLAGAGTTGTRTLAANGMATAVKTTGTTWIISGNGLT